MNENKWKNYCISFELWLFFSQSGQNAILLVPFTPLSIWEVSMIKKMYLLRINSMFIYFISHQNEICPHCKRFNEVLWRNNKKICLIKKMYHWSIDSNLWSIDSMFISFYGLFFQEITSKLEQHKEIIDTNNKSYNDMKVRKDDLQNERR